MMGMNVVGLSSIKLLVSVRVQGTSRMQARSAESASRLYVSSNFSSQSSVECFRHNFISTRFVSWSTVFYSFMYCHLTFFASTNLTHAKGCNSKNVPESLNLWPHLGDGVSESESQSVQGRKWLEQFDSSLGDSINKVWPEIESLRDIFAVAPFTIVSVKLWQELHRSVMMETPQRQVKGSMRWSRHLLMKHAVRQEMCVRWTAQTHKQMRQTAPIQNLVTSIKWKKNTQRWAMKAFDRDFELLWEKGMRWTALTQNLFRQTKKEQDKKSDETKSRWSVFTLFAWWELRHGDHEYVSVEQFVLYLAFIWAMPHCSAWKAIESARKKQHHNLFGRPS